MAQLFPRRLAEQRLSAFEKFVLGLIENKGHFRISATPTFSIALNSSILSPDLYLQLRKYFRCGRLQHDRGTTYQAQQKEKLLKFIVPWLKAAARVLPSKGLAIRCFIATVEIWNLDLIKRNYFEDESTRKVVAGLSHWRGGGAWGWVNYYTWVKAVERQICSLKDLGKDVISQQLALGEQIFPESIVTAVKEIITEDISDGNVDLTQQKRRCSSSHQEWQQMAYSQH